jgi:hypothetical protein
VITFDPVTPAPLAVRIARAVVPLGIFAGYLAFRAYPAADGRIPLGEAVVMGLVLMGLAMVACIALADLVSPIRVVRAASPAELELTAEMAPVADPASAVVAAFEAETERLARLLPERPTQNLPAVGALPDDWSTPDLTAHNTRLWHALNDDTVEYDLLTHEFQPQHHTPPSGFPAVDPDEMSSTLSTGRHHRVDTMETGLNW